MAVVDVLSYTVQDAAGKQKTFAQYIATGTTVTDIQDIVNTGAPLLDAVVDGKIISAQVQLALDLPGGLKADAVDENRVREGALLDYTADDTSYRQSFFVPSAKNDDFVADSDDVDNSGAMAAFITFVLGFFDRAGNALSSYIGGVRTFRK
jgi:hypothetical protein